jgi:Uma2 family endonuclease
MQVSNIRIKISPEEYLETEKSALIRHEYVSGEIYAMAGSSDRHNLICMNLVKMLDDHLLKSECDVFFLDLKLRADDETYYYPDVFVACDENPESSYYREKPVLVIEVLSPSTRQIDRREKLKVYRQIPSLNEYAIIEQDKVHIELHRRQANGSWITQFYSDSHPELDVDFQSVNLLTSLGVIYSRVRFPDQNTSD